MGENGAALLLIRGCSSPMSPSHNTDVLTFLKLMKIIEYMKMIQMPYLDMWSMLLSGKVTHRGNSSKLFWNRLF